MYKLTGTLLIIFILFMAVNTAVVQGSDTGLYIQEVYYYAYPDEKNEYVMLHSDSTLHVNNLTLTDGEGMVILHNITLEGNYYIAENRTWFLRMTGFEPNALFTDKFKLSNEGDEVLLYLDGALIDAVVYGDSTYNGPGWSGSPVHGTGSGGLLRRNAQDTNTAQDWVWDHPVYAGQSQFEPLSVYSKVEVYQGPDGVYKSLRDFLSDADNVLISVYTFSSYDIASLLSDKNAKVLVEGGPVGGIPEGETDVLEYMAYNGADVRLMVNDEHTHDRYTYVHTKYVVKDNRTVWLSTENINPDGLGSNRGYAIVIDNATLAEYLASVFYDDFYRWNDTVEVEGMYHEPVYDEQYGDSCMETSFYSQIDTVLAPDYSNTTFKNFINNADAFLYVECPYMDEYVADLVVSSRAKDKMVILDSSDYALERNTAMIDYLTSKYVAATLYNTTLESTGKLHGKLAITEDGVFVGSINIGLFSMTKNRELSVILRSDDAVNWFKDRFMEDFTDVMPPVAGLSVPDTVFNLMSIKMDASSSHDNSGALNYTWYINGNVAGHDVVQYHVFMPWEFGTRNITLEVRDTSGNVDIAYEKITLYPNPVLVLVPLVLVYFVFHKRR